MSNLQRFFTWYRLLNKRLLKKISFVLILCSIPLMALIVSIVSAYSSETVKIVLAAEDPSDPVSVGIIEDLVANPGIIRFTRCDDTARAREMVRYGEADAAWIFDADTDGKITGTVRGNTVDSQCVKVLERTDDVALKLSREKLVAALAPRIGFRVLTENYRELVDPEAGDDELMEYYSSAEGDGDIFTLIHPSGEAYENPDESFFILPVRGMMAVAMVLCGLATSMFYLHDEDSGVFCRMSRSVKPLFSAGYHLTGVLDVALVVLVSVFICGVNVSLFREIVSMLVYSLAVTAFSIFVRLLCGTARRLSVITPIIVMALVVISPILFSIPQLLPLQLLTPTYYYLISITDSLHILYMAFYTLAVGAIDLIIFRMKTRQ